MKNLKKLGKVLSTKEQKNVNGGQYNNAPMFSEGGGSGLQCPAFETMGLSGECECIDGFERTFSGRCHIDL